MAAYSRSVRSSIAQALVGGFTLASSLFMASACDKGTYYGPQPRPTITKAALSGATTVNCWPGDTGGACPISVIVSFRLPEDQFITGGIVRFQHDGSDRGVDHFFPLPESRFGAGEDKDVSISIDTAVPPTLVGVGTLRTFSVRLQTGAGEESDESTLQITVTAINPHPDTGTGGGTSDAGT